MRRVALSIALVVASVALSAAGRPPPARYATFTQGQRAELSRVSTYLNSIRSLKGAFVQIDPNGNLEQGEFYLSKPGRMRFQYQPPNPLLIVSDGNTVAVKNAKLNTVDRYPLNDTPLDLILGDKVDLNSNLAITGMTEDQSAIVIRARSQSSHTQGDIAIAFAKEPLELRQWTVIDAQGLSTTVALKDVETGVALPDNLFVLRDTKNPFTRKGEE
jgi:outer membrane lipoprotein-sorting protein